MSKKKDKNQRSVKKRKILVSVVLVTIDYFSNLKSAEAIGLSLPPRQVVRVEQNYVDKSEVKIAKIVTRKKDRIAYNSNREMLYIRC